MTHRLSRTDLIQLAIGLAFAASAFLPWYATDAGNPASNIDGERGDLSPWDVHPTLRWIMLSVAVAALLSAWQTWHPTRRSGSAARCPRSSLRRWPRSCSSPG